MAISISEFIQSRRTIDNFWNLMFFLGFVAGFAISIFIEFLTKTTTFAGIVWWITILGVPYFIKKNSGITFDKESMHFMNRDNEILNDRKPNTILMIICIGMSFVLGGQGGVVFKDSMIKSVCMFFFGSLSILGPVLYCMLKNFPIVVYFKKDNWIGGGYIVSDNSGYRYDNHGHHSVLKNHHQQSSHFNKTHNSSASRSSNWYTDPNNHMFSGNIYNRK